MGGSPGRSFLVKFGAKFLAKFLTKFSSLICWDNQIMECFRGQHRRGHNFTSFLRFSGPFVHAAK